MGLYLPIYNILSTNLLTQCPVPVIVFYVFFTFQVYNTKRSPITTKLFDDFSGPKEDLEASEGGREAHEGPTTHQGAPWGAAP